MRHSRSDYNRIQDPEKKIPDDEPVFLLRGQDKLAAPILRMYAHMCKTECPELVASVQAQADAMDEWDVKKTPDLPGE
jgi:hypothetical protein